MRGLTVAVLGVVTAVAVGGAAIVVAQNRPATTLAQGQRLFGGLEDRLATAQVIEIAKHDGKFSIVRHDDKWLVPDKSDYPARADMVRKLLVGLGELETIEAKTRNPQLYDRLNLQDPSTDGSKAVQITVKDGQGATLASLLIGKRRTPPVGAAASTAGDMIYVRKAGDAQTWLVQGQVEMHDNAVDWAVRDVVDIASDKIAAVELEKPDAKPFAIFREKPEDKDFKIRAMPADKTVKSQWDVNAVAGVLEALTFDDVAKDGAFPFGPARGTDRFRTKDGLVLTISLLPKDQETWVRVSATGEGEAATQAKELSARLSGWVYRLPDYKRDKLLTKLDDLLQAPTKPQS